jgi:hypothetical protein
MSLFLGRAQDLACDAVFKIGGPNAGSPSIEGRSRTGITGYVIDKTSISGGTRPIRSPVRSGKQPLPCSVPTPQKNIYLQLDRLGWHPFFFIWVIRIAAQMPDSSGRI